MPSFLLVRLGSLGDVVHAMPVAAALRARFPSARIDWMVDPRYEALVHLVKGVDGTVGVDPRRQRSRLVPVLRDLRRVRYDAAIDLQGLLKSAVLARLAGAERTIGFPRGHLREPPARIFYSETPDPGDAVHVIRKNLSLLAPLGIRDAAVDFPLETPDDAVIERMQAAVGEGPYALLTAGAGWPNKCWPAERFGRLAALMRERLGLQSIVLWGAQESATASAVVTASDRAATLAPPTNLPELVALARQAAVLVGGDTGPLHLAAAAGTPVVAIVGPSLPERNGPWDEADQVVSRAEGCACLYQRQCRHGRPCIEDIGVQEVLAAVERRLATVDRRPV